MEKDKAKNQKEKKPNRFIGFFKRIGRYFKEVFGETKKLAWPTRKELVSYTLTVLAFVAVFAVIIGLLDFGFNFGMTQLSGLSALAS
ncbi:MAG: preprotein translocase subunit SecE [Candidatus Gastranaerophilaceae bacterium]|jgi:preprotein translocase subunit SecE|nr:preprotein translocase subunit SecE [Christensenellales bacterium]